MAGHKVLFLSILTLAATAGLSCASFSRVRRNPSSRLSRAFAKGEDVSAGNAVFAAGRARAAGLQLQRRAAAVAVARDIRGQARFLARDEGVRTARDSARARAVRQAAAANRARTQLVRLRQGARTGRTSRTRRAVLSGRQHVRPRATGTRHASRTAARLQTTGLACPASPSVGCDFVFKGYEAALPVLVLPSDKSEKPFSTPLVTSVNPLLTVQVGNTGKATFLAPAPPGTLADGSNPALQDTFYFASTPAQLQARNLQNTNATLTGLCVQLPLLSLQLSGVGVETFNLNPGDGNQTFIEARRCVVFKT